ncbi:HupE/UreJ family protein [Mangrovicella endophytica]|uniref:HupE/UreJ family protein n=1 Tax=Mangrovicella endophytica TaxID=2066697 RepID=UPI000C9E2A23|nr:HupE/UreJ family protein [Mangrovicella endophytica]
MFARHVSTTAGQRVVCLSAVLLLLWAKADPADAHIVSNAGGFSSGFEHPLTGSDHLLAMLAVGIWGAQMGGAAVWTLPVTFPLIMVVGGVLGMLGLPIPDVEVGIALSMIVLGGAIAAAWKAPGAVALVIVSVFAICHGYAHGAELPLAADPADYAVGFVIATGLIHVLGVAVGLVSGKFYDGIVSRCLGGLIALAGAYFLLV